MSTQELLAAYRQRLAERTGGSGSGGTSTSKSTSSDSEPKPATTKKQKLKDVARKRQQAKSTPSDEREFNATAHPRAAAGSPNGGQFVSKKESGQGSAAPTNTRSEKLKKVLTPKQAKLQLSPERKAAFDDHEKLVSKQNWSTEDHAQAEGVIKRLQGNGDHTQAASLIDKRNREQQKQAKREESASKTDLNQWQGSVIDDLGGYRSVLLSSGDRGMEMSMTSSLLPGGKGADPDSLNLPGEADAKQTILGLTPNTNNTIGVHLNVPRSKKKWGAVQDPGTLSQQEQTDLVVDQVLKRAKEGSVVVLRADSLMETTDKPPATFGKTSYFYESDLAKELQSQGMSNYDAKEKARLATEDNAKRLKQDTKGWVANHPITQHMTNLDPEEGVYSSLVGIVRNGKLTPLTKDDLKRAEVGKKVRDGKLDQLDQAIQGQEARQYGQPAMAKGYEKREEQAADKVAKLDDQWVGRKPVPGAVKSVDHYKERANDWAKSQGFADGGVNGFTAEATKAHDLSHPVTHDLIGMDSKAIHEHFGSIMQKGGTPSLLGEEAIVNVVEHLSRGDSLEASVISGMRVARVLSRNAGYETDEGRNYVRGDEFKDKLFDLADQVYKNDNFNEYMKIVRQSNRISGTVTMAGNDFTNTASGG